MTGTYIQLPSLGSPFWSDPVADVASLPASGEIGESRITLDTGTIYYWDGAAWVATAGGGGGFVPSATTVDQAAATTTGVGATGVFGNVVSITIAVNGIYRIIGLAGFQENGAVLTTSLSCAISTSATGVGLTALDVSVYNGLVSSTSDLVVQAFPVFATVVGSTTYYLNTKFFYTSGTPMHYGRIRAERIG